MHSVFFIDALEKSALLTIYINFQIRFRGFPRGTWLIRQRNF